MVKKLLIGWLIILFVLIAVFQLKTDSPKQQSNLPSAKDQNSGTEAAAVTAITMGVVSDNVPPPPPPFKMVVDHPFICAIIDYRSNTILFLGSIVNPQ